MFAFEIPGARFSLPAGGAVALHRFVSVGATGAIQGNASNKIIGVSMNEVTADELAANERIIEIADGLVMVEAGGAVTAGSAVSSNADGKAVAGGDAPCGVAITSATGDGQLITVKI
jgi:hypothetical protein